MIAGPAAAQTELKTFTVEQAVAYAREHQPSLQAAQARARAAQEQTAVAWTQWTPRLGGAAELVASTTNNTTATVLGPSQLDLPRIGGTSSRTETSASWSPSGTTLLGVGIRQELFDFGRIASEAAVDEALAAAAQQRAEGVKLDLDLLARNSAFAVLAAKAILTTAEAAYTRAKEERDYAAAGVHNGLRSPIDLTRAEADLMRLDAGRIRAQGGLTVARGVFAAVIGFDAPFADVDPGGAQLPEPPPLDQGRKLAGERDPVIQEAQARLKAQQAQSKTIVYEMVPDLVATSGLSARAGGAAPSDKGPVPAGAGWAPDVPNWDVGLVLNWKIFDLGMFARRRVSREYESARASELQEANLTSGASVEQAYASLAVARQALPALQRSVEAAQANYAQAQARFRAGLGTSVELADAEAVRTNAEVELALGEFESRRARARVARAIAEEP